MTMIETDICRLLKRIDEELDEIQFVEDNIDEKIKKDLYNLKEKYSENKLSPEDETKYFKHLKKKKLEALARAKNKLINLKNGLIDTINEAPNVRSGTQTDRKDGVGTNGM